MGVLGPSLDRRSGFFIRNGILLYKQLPWWTTPAPCGGSVPTLMSGGCRYYSPSVFALLPVHPGTLVAGRFTRVCEFHFLPNTLEPEPPIFYSNLADCGDPLCSATLQIPTLMLCWPWSFDVQAKGCGVNRPAAATTKQIVASTFQLGTAGVPWLRFFLDLSSCVRWMQRQGTACIPSTPWDIASSPMCLSTVTCFWLVTVPVWTQNPDSHLPKVYTPNKVLYTTSHEVNRTYTA
jgi:hypothetical protein